VIYRGLPYNEIEDLLPGSPAWKQVGPLLIRQEGSAIGRPITPLHGGHVGLLCTAGLLNGVFGEGDDPKQPHGVCEVRLKKGRVVYEGQHFSLSELRAMGRKGWREHCPRPAIFIIPKDKGKLSYFWRHAYAQAESGPHRGGVVNPDTGTLIRTIDGDSYTRLDFDKLKVTETVERPKGGTKSFSPLWQADRNKTQRMAPIEFIGRFMNGWFDLAIADDTRDTLQERSGAPRRSRKASRKQDRTNETFGALLPGEPQSD
jgi:hypothetical protein